MFRRSAVPFCVVRERRAPQLEMETTAAIPAGTQNAALTKPHGVKCMGLHTSTSHEVTKHLEQGHGGTYEQLITQPDHTCRPTPLWPILVRVLAARFRPRRSVCSTTQQQKQSTRVRACAVFCAYQNDLYVWYARGWTLCFMTLGCLIGIPKDPKQTHAPTTKSHPFVTSLNSSMMTSLRNGWLFAGQGRHSQLCPSSKVDVC